MNNAVNNGSGTEYLAPVMMRLLGITEHSILKDLGLLHSVASLCPILIGLLSLLPPSRSPLSVEL